MIGLDTNVLVRYIVRDDTRQAIIATKWLETRCTEATPGFVSQLVLAEIFWVLARGYSYPKPLLVKVFAKLLAASELKIEQAADAWTALRAYQTGTADFADYLIGLRAKSAGCETLLTFDKRAAKSNLFTLAT